jgi:hypothetical protein
MEHHLTHFGVGLWRPQPRLLAGDLRESVVLACAQWCQVATGASWQVIEFAGYLEPTSALIMPGSRVRVPPVESVTCASFRRARSPVRDFCRAFRSTAVGRVATGNRLRADESRLRGTSYSGAIPFSANSSLALWFFSRCMRPMPRRTLGALVNWIFE